MHVHDAPFVRIHVPVYLERSLNLALERVLAPFFVTRSGDEITAVLREDEWQRIAPRFRSARVEAGYHLISLSGPLSGPAALPGVPLVSFHGDHLLVAAADLPRALEALARLPASPSPPSGGPPTP